MRNIRVNAGRLWQSLMDMAEIGALPNGGCRRLALTDEDKEGRDLFVRWCEEAGCTVSIDRMGNIFARRPGRNNDLPAVVTGSHLDTQPHGGKFDGVYGVLAGLEVIRTLNDHDVVTEAPIEASVWTNEEGSRFAPSMIASGVFAGKFDLEESLAISDADGASIGSELARIGYAGDADCGGRPIKAFLEAHIEQGPILEAEEKTIGIVTGAQCQRWYDVTLTGQDSHAGTTPMPMRKDCVFAMSRMIREIEDLVAAYAPDAVGTVGEIAVVPNSGIRWQAASTSRSTSVIRLKKNDRNGSGSCPTPQCGCSETGIGIAMEKVSDVPKINFDVDCIGAVRDAAVALNLPAREIVSGAGHDAMYLSTVAPASMIFVPCEGGLSHNEAEAATAEDLGAGCDVLLHAMLMSAEKAGA